MLLDVGWWCQNTWQTCQRLKELGTFRRARGLVARTLVRTSDSRQGLAKFVGARVRTTWPRSAAFAYPRLGSARQQQGVTFSPT